MGEPDEMRPGRGEFHEYPASCICQKPANYSSALESVERDHNSEGNSMFPVPKSRYKVNNSNPHENFQNFGNGKLKEEPASLPEETDHEDPMSD